MRLAALSRIIEEQDGAHYHYYADKVGEQRERQGRYNETCDQYADASAYDHRYRSAPVVLAFFYKCDTGCRAEVRAGTHHDGESNVGAHAKEQNHCHTWSVQTDACRHKDS